MKQRYKDFFNKRKRITAASAALVLALCACSGEDEQKEQSATPEKTEETAPALPPTEQQEEPKEDVSASEKIQEQIYELMVYGVAPQLATPNSPVGNHIREVLRLLNEQYELDKEELHGTSELARTAILIADMRRSFGAWDAALNDYNRALTNFNNMPDEERTDDAHMRWLSSIYYGKAYCYMQKRDMKAAQEQYDLRLANDEKRAECLPEFTPGAQVGVEVIPIVADLTSSMRTKAECMGMHDPEEARTYYQTAITKAESMLGLPDLSVHHEYLRLVSSAANHESRCNNSQKAMEYCAKVMHHCQQLHQNTQNQTIRQYAAAQFARCQEMYKKLEAGKAPATEEPMTEQPVVTEPTQPLPELTPPPATQTETKAEPAPAAEPPPAAAPLEQKPKKKSSRRRRR